MDLITGSVMKVVVPQDLEQFAKAKVESGDYASVGEVVRAGLRLLEDQDAERATRFEALRGDVGTGLAELDRGEGVPGPAVFEALRRRRGACGATTSPPGSPP